jgi:hypothetical protein
MKKNREDRKKDANNFLQRVKNEFEIIQKEDESAKTLVRMFSIVYPPCDNRSFDISFGNRIVDNNLGIEEKGSTIHYYEMDDCNICVMLYPITSQKTKPKEDSVLLEKKIAPTKLTRKKLQQHWNYFIAYSETTCLDGQATCLQQFRVYYLRWFKHLVVKNEVKNYKILYSISCLLGFIKDKVSINKLNIKIN